MMNDQLQNLYEVIQSRKDSEDERSYTAYLFREGLDKILKKLIEESGEVLLAAKSLEAAEAIDATKAFGSAESLKAEKLFDDEPEDLPALRDDFKGEVCDLIYHLLVLLAERDIPLDEIEALLKERAQKTGNLK